MRGEKNVIQRYLSPKDVFIDNLATTPEWFVEAFERDKVVMPDLIFTLENNPRKYFRPLVEINDGEFNAIGNRHFLEAAQKASLSEICVDIIPSEKWRSKITSLEDESSPRVYQLKTNRYHERFLYFDGALPAFSVENLSQGFPHLKDVNFNYANSCMHLIFYRDERDSAQLLEQEERIIKYASESHKLRSVDGLKWKTCLE